MLSYLRRLEAESIHITREVAGEFRRPVMLYSVGKDSSVMLHLARKAFHPSRPPFPLLHVDTIWKFPEMYDFRESMALKEGETVRTRRARFRTLGRRPLTGAIESAADSVPAVIDEMRALTVSERTGRLIDRDQSGSMERKKREDCS